jgi:sugar phosphate isomerase/epimerase
MKIGVSGWSLHREFFQNKIDIIDFIRIAKEEFGVDAIEIIHWMLAESTPEIMNNIGEGFKLLFEGLAMQDSPEKQEKLQAAFGLFGGGMNALSVGNTRDLAEVKAALDKYGVKVLNVPIDCGNISQLDEEARKADLALIKKWIDAAAAVGSKGARINTGQQPAGTFDLSITADSYRELAEYAETKGVALVMENHGGMSADPNNIIKLFEMVNHPNFRVCPDFGNFEDSIRYEGLEKIFNNPVLVHAKTYDFDENGEQVRFDFGKCMEIAKKHNYDGYYSVEFEGQGEQYEGVKKTIALLKKYL